MTQTPRQTLKVLHTADVHLDLDGYVSDPHTQRYRQINHQAFSTVIDLAIQENVDLLLIAGDLFDSNRRVETWWISPFRNCAAPADRSS